MLKHGICIFLLILGVRSDDSFVFPDEVNSRHNTGSEYSENSRDRFNGYGNSFVDEKDEAYGSNKTDIHILGNPTVHILGVAGSRPLGHGHDQYPEHGGNYHGYNSGLTPGFGHHHGYNNKPYHPSYPIHGGIVSQSQAQSTGSGSLTNSHGQFFNQISESAAQSQAQSSNSYGSSGGSGASSASSAASATSGIVNGVAVASASAAAAAAGSGNDGASSASASASSSTGNSNGFSTGYDQLNPWYYRNRIAGRDSNADSQGISVSSGGFNEASIVFSDK